MGLLKAAFGSAGGVLADQWREWQQMFLLPGVRNAHLPAQAIPKEAITSSPTVLSLP